MISSTGSLPNSTGGGFEFISCFIFLAFATTHRHCSPRSYGDGHSHEAPPLPSSLRRRTLPSSLRRRTLPSSLRRRTLPLPCLCVQGDLHLLSFYLIQLFEASHGQS